jgi:hypothetical protein
MASTVKFFSMKRSGFPLSGEAGSVYFANDTAEIFLCCGADNYFGLSGLLQPNVTMEQVIDAAAISGFPIQNPFVLPADGCVLQFDLASKTWKQVALPAAGVTVDQATSIAIAMAIALG